MAVLFFTACDTNNDIVGGNAVEDGNSIILDLSSSSLPLGRAVAATGAEVKVDYIDVLIFDEAGNKEYHERVSGSETGNGTIALKAKRNGFDVNAKYWVYLIANSTADESVFTDPDFDRTKLMGLTQEDRNIHMTGYPGLTNVPQVFLMDGIAYPANEEEPALTAAAPVVLYDGDDSNDTKLKATLRRAAAKIVVQIKKGQFVEFDYNAISTGYYLRNIPCTTPVVTGVDAEAKLVTSDYTDNDYFKWTQDPDDPDDPNSNRPYTLITVTAYTYAHEWENESALEKETRLIVNIPMKYTPHDADGNPTGEPVEYSSSYYQIPVCRGKSLERNTYYEVSLTLNVPGGTDPMKPVELEPISYDVQPWEEKTINIGGESDRPEYLTLNENEFEMHNIDDDHTTLQFSSSSEVTASITKVYYIDKFGDEQELEKRYPDDPDSNEWGVKTTTGGYWPTTTWSNLCDIRITPDEGINGKIDVFGDVPENNAVRYIEFTVTNETGQERKVVVAQYPLEYITHVVGEYSYRSDFGGTTWENYRNPSQKRVSAYSYNANNNTWQYSATGYGQNYFFTSKVANKNGNNYSISYYYYRNTGSNSLSTSNINGLNNPRMYHVQITASSGEYTLGKPRITTEGITDPGNDNAELVSPSFMLASQLGAVFTVNSVAMAASHCKEYVEVAEDGTVYSDWRLPTRAEVEIIMKFQYKENAAMDEVLSGRYYYCADGGTVENTYKDNFTNNNTAIRCIRDAYNDK